AALQVPLNCGDHLVSPRASVGAAAAPVEYADLPELLRVADQRMYSAKPTSTRGPQAAKAQIAALLNKRGICWATRSSARGRASHGALAAVTACGCTCGGASGR